MKNGIRILLTITAFAYLIYGEAWSGIDMDNLRLEIMDVEQQFANMAAKKGVSEAFIYFAAEDAVIMRNSRVYKGREEIEKYFDSVELKDIRLKWKPDFVDVSLNGEMAYTYGKFEFSAKDKAGKPLKSNGIFHTVWKRQVDGKWKFVWD